MAVERERAVMPPRRQPELEILRELPVADAWAGSSLDALFRELRWRLADPEQLVEFLRQVPAWQRQSARLALVAACAGAPERLAWAQRLANDALGPPARSATATAAVTPRRTGSYAERYDALRAETVEAALLR